jgi:acetyltransferase
MSLATEQLHLLFNPKVVALIGATDKIGSVGFSTFSNLLNNKFTGIVYAVNPQHTEIMGQKCYSLVSELPKKPDLVIIATPAITVPGVLIECVAIEIPAAIILSSGFKESGASGVALEQEILRITESKMRILGPNCLGLMNPLLGLNATFAQAIARPGNIAFLSQSGALCTAILDWSLKENLGFSGFVSMGSMADVGWADLIRYFGEDKATKSLILYIESVGDGAAFLAAAREVSAKKPIVVIKAGRTPAAAKAAASHTGSLTGSDDVLEVAFQSCGILRVDEISELFDMAEVLSKQPLPKGRKLGIVTNAGGPGVLAADALAFGGGELATLAEATISDLNRVLPAAWSHGNPVDILGDADTGRFGRALRAVINDTNADGLLVIMTPQAMTNPLGVAREIQMIALKSKKPVLAAFLGGASVEEATESLLKSGIPTFSFPDEGARIFNYMCRLSENIQELQDVSEVSFTPNENAKGKVQELFSKIKKAGRTLLTEDEAKAVFAIYGIPVVPTQIAKTSEEAELKAEKIKYPVVLKVYSETVSHKTDVGGVKLNLHNSQEVCEAFLEIQQNIKQKVGSDAFQGVTIQPMIQHEGYELILGMTRDPQFGPVLMFGAGGELVEVFKDRSLALPPLSSKLALRMMAKTKIYTALQGVRGHKAVKLSEIENILITLGQLAIDNPQIQEMDMNPLMVSESKTIALDARIVIS